MTPLSNRTLGTLAARVRVPRYDRARLTPGIVHIGVGNFHRVHEALAVEACLEEPGNEGWAISGVGILDSAEGRAKAEAFRAQDCLYTVTELAADGGATTRVVGAMVEYLYAPDDPEAVLARMSAPTTHIVSLTITEGGYDVGRALADGGGPGKPRTAFDFIVEALDRRRRASLPPFTVMSCDNLRGNGDTARRAVLAVAERHGGDLAAMIGDAVAFPNSMVDRIAPAVSEADRQAVNAASGIDDALPATCESYTSWVMEDRFCDGRPPFERVGAQLRDDVAAFVAVKGRLSNAAHMLMCYPSLLMGQRLVNQAMADPRITQLLQAFWTIDAIPLIEAPPGLSPQRFTAEVIERFANPGINDQLLRVAGDGASKIEVFHGKTIQELVEGSRPLDREAFLLACYVRYLGGRDDLGVAYPVHEPALEAGDRRLFGSSDPADGLALSLMRRLGVDRSEAFRAAFSETFAHLCRHGVSSALDALLTRSARSAPTG